MSRKTVIGANASGMADPTAAKAISHADKEINRMRNVMTIVNNVCNKNGFIIDGEIILIDKKTGRRVRVTREK